MKVVYICGPFTGPRAWDIEQNVRRAEELALEVAMLGASPLCPHTNTRFFHGTCTEEFWYEATAALLAKCDALITVFGWRNSRGSRAEIELAQMRGIPTFHDLGSLRAWLVGDAS